jgi:hypothetical protein
VLAVTASLFLGACSSDDTPGPDGQPSANPANATSTPIRTSEAPASELPAPPAATQSRPPTSSSSPSGSTSLDDGRAPAQVWSYADGSLSAWSEVHAARPEQVRVVDDPVRPGYEHSGAFTAGPGDHTFGVDTTIRGEVRSTIEEAGSPGEGDVQWYSWSTYFPEDFEWDGEDQFLIYTQWHQTANSGSPNIDLWVTDGDQPELRMSVRGGLLGEDVSQYTAVYDLGPLERGEWLDHTVRIKWSSDPDEGNTKVWIDGERRVNAAAANLYEGQSAYLKQGIYAANNTTREHTVYFSDALRGNSEESVALEPARD